MESIDGKTVTEALIANVLNTRFEDIEDEVIDNTKRRILDTIGCAIGGARAPGNAELIELVKSWGGRPDATILASGVKGPVHNVAMVNCILCRSFDWGPLTLIIDGDGGPGTVYIDGKPIRRFAHHITETTALTALAVGESRGVNGKELITALVVGDDLAARLHIANDRTPPGQAPSPDLAPPPMTRGSTAIFGAAAIAGRLLGLNGTQMRNAFGLAMMLRGVGAGGMFAPSQPVPPPKPAGQSGSVSSTQSANPGWLGVNDPFFKAQLARGGYEETVSIKLSNGIEARDGINAAQLAKAGWPGVKDPFFGERGGYYPGLASCNRPERITEGLGKKYHVEQVFKPWPGGRPTNAPTEAALAIVSKHDINTDDIKEVILHLSNAAAAVHYSKPYIIGDYPIMNALWSFYFTVASALYRKSSKNENFTDEKIRDPKLQALIKKVKLADLDKDEGVELEVRMKDGRTFSEYVRVALGEPYRPLSRDGLIAKFMEQVEFSQTVSQEDAKKLIRLVERLEEVDNVAEIVKLAVKR